MTNDYLKIPLPTAIIEALNGLRSSNAKEREFFSHQLAEMIMTATISVEIGSQIAETFTPAFIDQKTGLYNWTIFKQFVESYIANPEAAPAIVMSFDLINFKAINDFKGQEVGDILIAGFGRALHRIVRQPNETRNIDIATNLIESIDEKVPSRIGGDEFAVILTGINNPANVNLDSITKHKIHQLLGDQELMALIRQYELATFGVRAGANWLQAGLSYSQNMVAAHPKNQELANENLRAASIIKKTDQGYRLIDLK